MGFNSEFKGLTRNILHTKAYFKIQFLITYDKIKEIRPVIQYPYRHTNTCSDDGMKDFGQ